MDLGRYKGLVYLGLLVVVLPFVAWKLAIGQTWHLWRQTARQATELARLSSEMPPADVNAAVGGPDGSGGFARQGSAGGSGNRGGSAALGDAGSSSDSATQGIPAASTGPMVPRAAASADTLEYIRSGLLIERLLPTMEAARVTVVKYSPCVTSFEGGLNIHTAELLISGGFVPMVRVIDNLEKRLPGCKLVSVNFRSIRRQYNRPARLEASLVVQQIVFNK